MLDTPIRRTIDPWLDAIAQRLVRLGINANGVTWAGFAVGALAAVAISLQFFITGMALLLISRLADGLDGAVARQTQASDLGGFLDIVLDFAFYGAIPLAFIVVAPTSNGLMGGVLLLAFYVNGASFLTFALMAEKQGLAENVRGSKSLLYTIGLTEATETIICFCLMCLFPQWFNWLAGIFAAMVVVTTASRLVLAYRTFE